MSGVTDDVTNKPPDRTAGVKLSQLPSDVLLTILVHLDATDVRSVACSCSTLRAVATSDAAWRPIVSEALARSPPARSANLTPLQHIPAPWDSSFGMVSAGRSPAQREEWSACTYGDHAEPVKKKAESMIPLSLFPGATSFYTLYWTYLRSFLPLQGWWLGDVHSYGMTIRIVFDAKCKLNDGEVEPLFGPAFVCEKLHFVNRLYGMASDVDAWTRASGFDLHVPISTDGASIESGLVSIDIAVPGVKTELLWTASWHDYCAQPLLDRHSHISSSSNTQRSAKIQWSGAGAPTNCPRRDRHAEGSTGPRSIIRRAHDLASQMAFGVEDQNRDPYEGMEDDVESETDEEAGDEWAEMDEEDDELEAATDEVFGLGAWPLHIRDAFGIRDGGDVPQQGMRLPPVIQQRIAGHLHTIYLSSGAICTAPIAQTRHGSKEGPEDRVSLILEPFKLYHASKESSTRAFGLKLSNFLPLPPLEFPSPALLPIVRKPGERRTHTSETSAAFEDFLDQGTEASFMTMQMEPCPPYLPWPHLSQPLPTGIRFIPVQPPPLRQTLPPSRRVERRPNGIARYQHIQSLAPQLDPSSSDFDWNQINGLYAMTYGPWGQELIYIRSRILTVHDFAPDDLYLSEGFEETLKAEKQRLTRPTGPHGTGHTWHRDEAYGSQQRLYEGLHWKPEPYVDVSDLEMPPDETRFIKPGCRVIEGVKCTGDANVPRGTITFRAFSRGHEDDQCVAWFPPDETTARHPPWTGVRPSSSLATSYPFASTATVRTPASRHSNGAWLQQPTPGRVLDCATGRLAMEGFVNAGTWRRCSVKITSVDQINVHWHALHKVAVAHRLFDC